MGGQLAEPRPAHREARSCATHGLEAAAFCPPPPLHSPLLAWKSWPRGMLAELARVHLAQEALAGSVFVCVSTAFVKMVPGFLC